MLENEKQYDTFITGQDTDAGIILSVSINNIISKDYVSMHKNWPILKGYVVRKIIPDLNELGYFIVRRRDFKVPEGVGFIMTFEKKEEKVESDN